MTEKKKLTKKMEMFCKEYLIDHNATQAAIRAGYSKHTANEIGNGNLAKASIKERIAELQAPKIKKLDLTADMVMAELKNLAFSNIGDFFDDDGYIKEFNELTRDQTAAIASIDFQYFKPRKDLSIEEMIEGEDPNEGRLHISQASKLKFWDKTKSLGMLGTHFSLFKDKQFEGGDDEEMEESFL